MKAESRAELTLRGLVLGVLITLVFTAANVYFGLKAGLTFATSIPAAVISMAVLRSFRGATIQENNIVQTVASAAGTLSSIIFVLPGLIMIGWWSGFPYWVSFAICLFGGTLGVMYSIPLRRALVTQSDLPYPEGVACAEVLKVGSGEHGAGVEETDAGLSALLWGSVVSGAFSLVTATRLFASDVARNFRVGERGVSGYDFLLSFALFGVGHLVGLWVGVAMGVGALIAWVWGVPHFSALSPDSAHLTDAALNALAHDTWSHKVRFVGAGTIGVAAVWTLGKLAKPVIAGLRSAMVASRTRAQGNAALLPRTEQDIPIGVVGIVSLLCLLPAGVLLAQFVIGSGLSASLAWLVISGVLYIAIMSALVSAVCGYMAGLIGSSNSPLSGIGILAVIGFALILVFGVRIGLSVDAGSALVAYALLVTAVVFAAAAIANNNLQDLKTGQLVDATPWKQQVALIVGVIAGAAVIPPVLDLLNRAYGFAGTAGSHHEHPLPAPQAGLISALAQGVIQNNVDWSLIQIGGVIGVFIIAADALLRKLKPGAHLSPLAVGLGIYLPTQSTLMVVVGAVAGWFFDQRAQRSARPEATRQLGVLLASGMIVGEGLVGVLVAALVAFSGKDFPLSIVSDAFADTPAVWLGGLVFAVVIYALYRRVARALR
ncbi:MAG TPA: oligopeptide transporter, OPT family [Steroidobacteraceae bacterium]|jgi:putative OPT family oligopeptide transporter|nr:oligopeptide transporter, OPT family [Steroidobacteraceae bacterium]